MIKYIVHLSLLLFITLSTAISEETNLEPNIANHSDSSKNSEEKLDKAMKDLDAKLKKMRSNTSEGKDAARQAEHAQDDIDTLLADLCEKDPSLCNNE